MEIISDIYGDIKTGERTSTFNKYNDFCTITLEEGQPALTALNGIVNSFKIRFNANRPNDLLLLQQLRSDIEKAIKFIINT